MSCTEVYFLNHFKSVCSYGEQSLSFAQFWFSSSFGEWILSAFDTVTSISLVVVGCVDGENNIITVSSSGDGDNSRIGLVLVVTVVVIDVVVVAVFVSFDQTPVQQVVVTTVITDQYWLWWKQQQM